MAIVSDLYMKDSLQSDFLVMDDSLLNHSLMAFTGMLTCHCLILQQTTPVFLAVYKSAASLFLKSRYDKSVCLLPVANSAPEMKCSFQSTPRCLGLGRLLKLPLNMLEPVGVRNLQITVALFAHSEPSERGWTHETFHLVALCVAPTCLWGTDLS